MGLGQAIPSTGTTRTKAFPWAHRFKLQQEAIRENNWLPTYWLHSGLWHKSNTEIRDMTCQEQSKELCRKIPPFRPILGPDYHISRCSKNLALTCFLMLK